MEYKGWSKLHLTGPAFIRIKCARNRMYSYYQRAPIPGEADLFPFPSSNTNELLRDLSCMLVQHRCLRIEFWDHTRQ